MVQFGRQQTRETHPILVASAEVRTLAGCVTGQVGAALQAREPVVSSLLRYPGWERWTLELLSNFGAKSPPLSTPSALRTQVASASPLPHPRTPCAAHAQVSEGARFESASCLSGCQIGHINNGNLHPLALVVKRQPGSKSVSTPRETRGKDKAQEQMSMLNRTRTLTNKRVSTLQVHPKTRVLRNS